MMLSLHMIIIFWRSYHLKTYFLKNTPHRVVFGPCFMRTWYLLLPTHLMSLFGKDVWFKIGPNTEPRSGLFILLITFLSTQDPAVTRSRWSAWNNYLHKGSYICQSALPILMLLFKLSFLWFIIQSVYLSKTMLNSSRVLKIVWIHDYYDACLLKGKQDPISCQKMF